MELYVERDMVEKLEAKLKAAKHKPTKVDINAAVLFNMAKADGGTQKAKRQDRLAILCARNPGTALRNAILEGCGAADKEQILTKAREMLKRTNKEKARAQTQ